MARRDPPKPTSQDVAQMSQHRCNVQALVDAMVNAVMRGGTCGGCGARKGDTLETLLVRYDVICHESQHHASEHINIITSYLSCHIICYCIMSCYYTLYYTVLSLLVVAS